MAAGISVWIDPKPKSQHNSGLATSSDRVLRVATNSDMIGVVDSWTQPGQITCLQILPQAARQELIGILLARYSGRQALNYVPNDVGDEN
jgi:hypothetical protein